MNKSIAQTLLRKAEEIADRYSNKDREFNTNKEKFTLEKVKPLSETTAIAIYSKTGGKKAIAFLFHVIMNEGTWMYVFPTESHIVGMQRLANELQEIDLYNFKFNNETTKELLQSH